MPSNQRDAETLAGELTQLAYAGEVYAVAMVILQADGGVREMLSFPNEAGVALIGAVTMMHHQLLGRVKAIAAPPADET
jgi:hypothetical protein